jgi:hypothetical protein
MRARSTLNAHRMSIPAGEVHRRYVSGSELAVLIDHRRRDVHSIPASGHQQIFGRGFMAGQRDPEYTPIQT